MGGVIAPSFSVVPVVRVGRVRGVIVLGIVVDVLLGIAVGILLVVGHGLGIWSVLGCVLVDGSARPSDALMRGTCSFT